jgi:hypothetical protein
MESERRLEILEKHISSPCFFYARKKHYLYSCNDWIVVVYHHNEEFGSVAVCDGTAKEIAPILVKYNRDEIKENNNLEDWPERWEQIQELVTGRKVVWVTGWYFADSLGGLEECK